MKKKYTKKNILRINLTLNYITKVENWPSACLSGLYLHFYDAVGRCGFLKMNLTLISLDYTSVHIIQQGSIAQTLFFIYKFEKLN